MMNLHKLYEMQKGLDSHIEEKHGLQHENLFDRKVLALLVEIGELANETRCFKFWSLKSSATQDVILEEFVDGIHFILSLGLECGFDDKNEWILDKKDNPHSVTMSEQFLVVYDNISHFQKTRSREHFQGMFKSYLMLADQLGFKESDIEKAYISKNEVNYKRQQEGY